MPEPADLADKLSESQYRVLSTLATIGGVILFLGAMTVMVAK